ncbi:MAG: hypothetical protein ACOYBY_17770 [Dermatophilaceae bacterium]
MSDTATSVITSAVSGMDTQLLSVAGVGLGVGVTLFVLRKGWRLVKGFTS